MEEPFSKRAFGRTGLQLTCVGLGGEGILLPLFFQRSGRNVII